MHSSARLASLALNHPCRQASSAYHSRCSLIQGSLHTLLTLPRQNHRCRQASSAHHLCCSLIQRSRHHCSLCSCRITDADRRHRPIACVAHSFSAFGGHCTLRSHRISALGIVLFPLQECHLVGDQSATWWHGSHDLSRPSTKVSAKSDHKQLKYSILCPLGAPPGG